MSNAKYINESENNLGKKYTNKKNIFNKTNIIESINKNEDDPFILVKSPNSKSSKHNFRNLINISPVNENIKISNQDLINLRINNKLSENLNKLNINNVSNKLLNTDRSYNKLLSCEINKNNQLNLFNNLYNKKLNILSYKDNAPFTTTNKSNFKVLRSKNKHYTISLLENKSKTNNSYFNNAKLLNKNSKYRFSCRLFKNNIVTDNNNNNNILEQYQSKTNKNIFKLSGLKNIKLKKNNYLKQLYEEKRDNIKNKQNEIAKINKQKRSISFMNSYIFFEKIVENSISTVNNYCFTGNNVYFAEKAIEELNKKTNKNIEKLVTLLENIPGFKRFISINGIQRKSLYAAALSFKHVSYEPNEYIFKMHDITNGFYCILSGKIELSKFKKANLNTIDKLNKIYNPMFNTCYSKNNFSNISNRFKITYPNLNENSITVDSNKDLSYNDLKYALISNKDFLNNVFSNKKDNSNNVNKYHYLNNNIYVDDPFITLLEGDTFGEYGILENSHRTASAKALVKSNLIYIDKEAFITHFKHSIEKVYIERKLFIINHIPYFLNFTKDEFHNSFLKTTFYNVKKNCSIMVERTCAKSIYIILKGSCKIYKYYNGGQIHILSTSEGDIIGLEAGSINNYNIIMSLKEINLNNSNRNINLKTNNKTGVFMNKKSIKNNKQSNKIVSMNNTNYNYKTSKLEENFESSFNAYNYIDDLFNIDDYEQHIKGNLMSKEEKDDVIRNKLESSISKYEYSAISDSDNTYVINIDLFKLKITKKEFYMFIQDLYNKKSKYINSIYNKNVIYKKKLKPMYNTDKKNIKLNKYENFEFLERSSRKFYNSIKKNKMLLYNCSKQNIINNSNRYNRNNNNNSNILLNLNMDNLNTKEYDDISIDNKANNHSNTFNNNNNNFKNNQLISFNTVNNKNSLINKTFNNNNNNNNNNKLITNTIPNNYIETSLIYNRKPCIIKNNNNNFNNRNSLSIKVLNKRKSNLITFNNNFNTSSNAINKFNTIELDNKSVNKLKHINVNLIRNNVQFDNSLNSNDCTKTKIICNNRLKRNIGRVDLLKCNLTETNQNIFYTNKDLNTTTTNNNNNKTQNRLALYNTVNKSGIINDFNVSIIKKYNKNLNIKSNNKNIVYLKTENYNIPLISMLLKNK